VGGKNRPRASEPSGRPRVPQRRSQLIATGSELFWELGYHGTTVADIAAACGITAAAVYRHVAGKETLLIEALREMIHARFAGAQAAVDGATDSRDAVRRLAQSSASIAVDRPAVVGLWHREARYVTSDMRRELYGLQARQMGLWRKAIQTVVPHVSADEAEIRFRVADGVLNCIPRLPSTHGRQWLIDVLANMLEATVLYEGGPLPIPDPLPERMTRSSPRVEQILTAGEQLFEIRGFHAVRVDDIGTAVGIKGPSIYEYYPGKVELLDHILTRVADRLDQAVDIDPDSMSERARSLAQLLGRYIGFADENRVALSVYATERQHLSLPVAQKIEQARLRRLDLLQGILRAEQPELSDKAVSVISLGLIEAVFASVQTNGVENSPDQWDAQLLGYLLHAATAGGTAGS